MTPNGNNIMGEAKASAKSPSSGSEFSAFFKAALSIVETANKMNVQLRLLGATAIYYQCPNSALLSSVMKRQLTDLDFMTISKYASKIPDIFSNLNFEPNERVNALFGRQRQIYTDPGSSLHVDVFFDKLSFNHVLNLSNRLTIDPVTISLADLFLEKLQIVKISEKDVKDVIVLVHEHDFGSQKEKGTIDADYVVKLLSDDWGFYYTVTNNMKKVMEFAGSNQSLTENDKQVVNGRLNFLLEKLQSSHKSLKWNMRAKIGTKTKWYDEAEDVENRE